jgi:hypothetical protein
MSSARRIAIVSAENMDAWIGSHFTRTLSWLTAAAATQTEPCNLAERLKNRLGYQDLISASQCIKEQISAFSTVEEVRWLPREG